MTVNGKQVTLAVFRQLYEEPLYDSRTWKAFGTPWCRVNYHPDKCDRDRDSVVHEHVVWQKDDELRRARVDRPLGTVDAVPRFDDRPEDELAVCVAAESIGNARIVSVQGADSYDYDSKTPPPLPAAYVAAKFDTGHQSEAKLHLSSVRVARVVQGYGQQPHPELHREHDRLHPSGGDGCARVAKSLSQRLSWADTWLERAQTRWDEVCELPQVFIAL
ncbi:hypothetical protein OHA25_60405 (plasmid) [Nonomuraea sp. NBC_00507]|uniref:hypothetical protein n=1 Tax=Nonomuraea sp. NBC_00507 TaxID=2976002 RepID=UPI002E171E87